MSDSTPSMAGDEPWSEYVAEMNETFFELVERNVEMQSSFAESWMDALEETTMDDMMVEGLQGTARAYEVWMEAAAEQFDLVEQAMSGEDVDPEAFRDVWLNAANEAFKEVMGTTAFAAATGQTVSDTLSASEQFDQTAQETLHSLGFASRGDIEEVGERLLELERRQHAIERKLDRVLDAVESEGSDEQLESDSEGEP